MKVKGVTMTIIFEAESLNYGEGIGNVTTLKKLSREGKQLSYISRQAIRYNIVNQFGEELTPVEKEKGNKSVIQFKPDATIEKYPEIDFFGYMKTKKSKQALTRSAKVRISNAISLEEFKGDIDFLTNKGLADRINADPNIAQSEMHRAFYRYTVNIDLDQIGIDENDNVNLSPDEKIRRIHKLFDVIMFLYRDIKGRRESLAPLFVIGGVYDIKNPFFQNIVMIENRKLKLEPILEILNLNENIKENTKSGLMRGIFENEHEIFEKLNAVSIKEFFEFLKERVKKYYESSAS
ncbi:type I-B CRISPR-associated protein Cas7/Cst2/DevR [Thermosipho atlanticus]|uniref:CRISPR-associated protein Cst2 n=1 Tax=Thermosipho atlanticus DSM 15807 TaxID=1123380 RepID=A0A1M5U4Y6_9BACT|nr:type I-B CRISPR-associated protein Cas7/Cst2/DevR [Thermosipho atlanticus]SHH57753.1 CRISPR-associated protein Cst2 [Thermosipho atlanticus DSM 15807]